MFGTGLILYLLNKEIYILGPETMHGIAIFTILIYGIKKLGPKVAEFMDKKREVSNQCGIIVAHLPKGGVVYLPPPDSWY